MCGSYSDLPNRPSDFGYFALTFRRPDNIYLLLAGQNKTHFIKIPKHLIATLKGYPWSGLGSEDVDACLLMATNLGKMASVG
uniref:Uncharacterized protein n=1 Tax=Romanomermis culicivorax TaxID=13658 RepID=A0A915J958_ROMCU